MSALGAAAPMAMNLAAMGSASAATASDYKALVCVFLHGGNDAYNTVLPTDQASWSAYTATRNQAPESIALFKDRAANKSFTRGSPEWLGSVLGLNSLNSAARPCALHPMLTDMQRLFNTDRRMAVLANVGPLKRPTTKQDYNSNISLPLPLFSHNDQQSQWQAMAPEGASKGWGGRMADMVASSNQRATFTAISVTGNSVWLAGDQVRQYSLAPSGAIRMALTSGTYNEDLLFNSAAAANAFKRITGTPGFSHVMASDVTDINKVSVAAEAQVRQYLPSDTIAPYGPASRLSYDSVSGGKKVNPLAQQFQAVARMISAGQAMGMKRQVFFVSLAGFDTHANQNLNHAELMARLNHGMAYFDSMMQSLNMSDQVTTFTASDFGRTFTSNGDGTDHGWGGHHFIMGGAVKGGDIYGAIPTLTAKNVNNNGFDGSPDLLYNGAMLPSVSVDQYGATLGKWFGLSASQLLDVFPNLGNFGNQKDLGFLLS